MRILDKFSNPPSPRASGAAGTIAARPQAVPVVLSDFETIEVTAPVAQDDLKQVQAHFMTLAQCAARHAATPAERERIGQTLHERMARYGTSSEYIARRQVSVLSSRFVKRDPGSESESIRRYGDLRNPTGETLDERMNLFEEIACGVFERVYREAEARPDDIVHVSCSGYVSPSPVQIFLSRRGWLDVGVTHSYHMGCYGAFPAVRTALGLVGSSYVSLPERKSRVDLVHTEFLSLHFDLLGDEPDNIVTSTLFADGFIKYTAYPHAEFAKEGRSGGLKVLAIDERILPDSLPEMTLRPGPLQFDMSLSKRVPFMIRDSIVDFVRDLCSRAGLDFERDKAAMTFAIHPGGPAILNQIRGKLGIDETAVEMSRRVLHEHGNMASATAPHIWKLIAESQAIRSGTKVLSMAFGPGLTVIGAVFEKV